jgi:hypothetical protein
MDALKRLFAAAGLLFAGTLSGQAQTVTALPDATLPLTGQEYLYLVQNGVGRRVHAFELGAFATLPPLPNDQIWIGNALNVATPVTVSGDLTISNTGVATLANSGISAGTYGDNANVPQCTFDAKGRATSCTNVAIAQPTPLTVNDGASVFPTTALNFLSGATVTDGGGGNANVVVTGSGGTVTSIIQGTNVTITEGSPCTANCTINASGGGGSGTVTSVGLAAGLATTVGVRNTGTDAITSTGTINPQQFVVPKAASYTVNADFGGTSDTGVELIATGAAVTFTAPNPSGGTQGDSYQLGSDGTHGFTLATVGGTKTFYGSAFCTGATTAVFPANVDVQITDDGTNYKCTGAAGAPPAGSAVTSITEATPDLVFTPDPITGTGTIGSTVPLDDCTSGNCTVSGSAALATGEATRRVFLGPHTYTLAQAGTAGFLSGWAPAELVCVTGPCVVTTTTSNFLPAAPGSTLTLQTGDSASLSSDGANYPTTSAIGASTATLLATGTGATLTAPREYYICTSTCAVTPPTPAAGYEFCIRNANAVSTVITLAALGGSVQYEQTDNSAYGTAGTGTLVSGGAVGDKVCIVGLDATHYLTVSFNGMWTAN